MDYPNNTIYLRKQKYLNFEERVEMKLKEVLVPHSNSICC